MAGLVPVDPMDQTIFGFTHNAPLGAGLWTSAAMDTGVVATDGEVDAAQSIPDSSFAAVDLSAPLTCFLDGLQHCARSPVCDHDLHNTPPPAAPSPQPTLSVKQPTADLQGTQEGIDENAVEKVFTCSLLQVDAMVNPRGVTRTQDTVEMVSSVKVWTKQLRENWEDKSIQNSCPIFGTTETTKDRAQALALYE